DASPTPEETQPPEATAAPEPATEASPEEPTNLDTEQIANEEPAPVEQPVEPLAEDTNELEPAPSPAPAQRVSFSLPQLSLLEKISISALIVILLGAGIYIASNSINKIPGTKAADELALPIKGKNMTIENVKTYWVEKTSADGTVLRDDEETNIVPVIQLHSSGKPATVRVFFRNEENDAVGDTITTTLTPGKAVDIAGSEGFHEFGKFAAYRAVTTEPWSVEVYEGPNERANLEEFKKILETTISITRH
ncbi:MAG: hypothetical protein KC910_34955, partial [Candidatus Eremiobacteraeota bacterium]|nr:hypothetical protein [Candidatus Eremiobacteraeota bacterium]